MNALAEKIMHDLGIDMPDLDINTPFAELAATQVALDADIAYLEKAASELKKSRDVIKKKILPEKMDAEGMQTITVKGVGRISVRAGMNCSVKKDAKLALQEWLRDNGFDELITEVVNASTLKAFIKEQMEAGNDVPLDYLNLHLFDQAVITKS